MIKNDYMRCEGCSDQKVNFGLLNTLNLINIHLQFQVILGLYPQTPFKRGRGGLARGQEKGGKGWEGKGQGSGRGGAGGEIRGVGAGIRGPPLHKS
jgi:hypothetical protein